MYLQIDSQQCHSSTFRIACHGGGGLAAEQREGEDGDLEEPEAGGEEGALPVLRVLHQGEQRETLPTGRMWPAVSIGH